MVSKVEQIEAILSDSELLIQHAPNIKSLLILLEDYPANRFPIALFKNPNFNKVINNVTVLGRLSSFLQAKQNLARLESNAMSEQIIYYVCMHENLFNYFLKDNYDLRCAKQYFPNLIDDISFAFNFYRIPSISTAIDPSTTLFEATTRGNLTEIRILLLKGEQHNSALYYLFYQKTLDVNVISLFLKARNPINLMIDVNHILVQLSCWDFPLRFNDEKSLLNILTLFITNLNELTIESRYKFRLRDFPLSALIESKNVEALLIIFNLRDFPFNSCNSNGETVLDMLNELLPDTRLISVVRERGGLTSSQFIFKSIEDKNKKSFLQQIYKTNVRSDKGETLLTAILKIDAQSRWDFLTYVTITPALASQRNAEHKTPLLITVETLDYSSFAAILNHVTDDVDLMEALDALIRLHHINAHHPQHNPDLIKRFFNKFIIYFIKNDKPYPIRKIWVCAMPPDFKTTINDYSLFNFALSQRKERVLPVLVDFYAKYKQSLNHKLKSVYEHGYNDLALLIIKRFYPSEEAITLAIFYNQPDHLIQLRKQGHNLNLHHDEHLSLTEPKIDARDDSQLEHERKLLGMPSQDDDLANHELQKIFTELWQNSALLEKAIYHEHLLLSVLLYLVDAHNNELFNLAEKTVLHLRPIIELQVKNADPISEYENTELAEFVNKIEKVAYSPFNHHFSKLAGLQKSTVDKTYIAKKTLRDEYDKEAKNHEQFDKNGRRKLFFTETMVNQWLFAHRSARLENIFETDRLSNNTKCAQKNTGLRK